MLSNRSDFLCRFLNQGFEDKPYWVTSRPTAEMLAQADAALKDVIGFEAHLHHFKSLTGVIDFCVNEYVDSMSGRGSAFQNTLKHPHILALAELDAKDQAGIVCAAAQGVRWIDEIQPWVKGHTLPNEIAKRVLIGILRNSTKLKRCFSQSELKSLICIGSAIQGQDSFGIIAQMAIVEILAANSPDLSLDKETQGTLARFLDYVASRSDLKGILKAIDKLRSKLNN